MATVDVINLGNLVQESTDAWQHNSTEVDFNDMDAHAFCA
ncbi:hypothetical protein SNOG_05692 [Parastagonospora nodorum SN15]|uniref:Uncharacterized protein n=1 Tax=Phaeosphaeria nodorum (strain SN15 / ATCC MYA-4574 / FGSC 10173) TaxID=321614 RepID=Q0URC2_PHANO|nr:hypothetical protein SNOG_05692 [Parastagonospora nodorum SN15]EAT86756.1 hypothetical protein SNOG_05692 [Parastagonospora nodorum SN15]